MRKNEFPSKTQDFRKRATCDICHRNPQKCQAVSKFFTRERMTEGYHFIFAIPESACHITVLDKKSLKNSLALRWKLSKEYFLNGNWVIEGSGNYSAKGNSFSYFNHLSMNDSNESGQWIKFNTQLTQAVDVDLIYQSENKDVKFSYLLPPFIKNIAGEQDKNLLAGTFWICGSQIMFGDTFMCTSLFFS